jgi:hypothetical protein
LRDGSKEFDKAYKRVSWWASKFESADEIPDGHIPKSYDFRNIDGYNFLGDVRD